MLKKELGVVYLKFIRRELNMTTPQERGWALDNARRFLLSLLDPKQTPRVPKSVRREARQRLKHYPSPFEIEQLKEKAPEILGNRR